MELELDDSDRKRYLQVRKQKVKEEKEALKHWKLRELPPSMRMILGPLSRVTLDYAWMDCEEER